MYADDTTIYFNTEDCPKDNFAKHITTELSLNVGKNMYDFSH